MAEDTDGFGTLIKNRTVDDDTLREVTSAVSSTVYWNYQRMNSVGHPIPE